MKKLFLSFAVLAGVCMVSCGNKAENAEEAAAADSTEVMVDEAVVEGVDSLGDTVAAAAVEAVELPADSAAAAN